MSDKKPDNLQERSAFDTVFFILGLLLRYKWAIIISTCAAAAGAVIFSILTLFLPADMNPLPNVYQSRAVIRFQTETSTLSIDSLLSSLGVQNSSRGVSDLNAVVLYILQSGPFLDSLIDEFNIVEKLGIEDRVKTHSRAFILSSSHYEYDRNSGLMTIAFNYTDPVFARDFINREIEFLQDWFLEQGGSTRSKQLEMLKQRMAESRTQIEEMESELREFQTKYGVLTVEALSAQLEDILSDLQTQLVQVEMEIHQYSQYSRIEDPALSRLKAERQNILSMIDNINSGYTIGGRTLPSRDELSDLSIRFSRLEMDLQIQQDIYQSIAQRFEVLRLAAIEENVFTVLEWGEVPEEKLGPRRSLICAQVTLGGLFGSIAVILLVYYLHGVLFDPEKIKLLKYSKGMKR